MLAAFVFGGAVVAFGVAIVASWLGLPTWAVWLLVIVALAALAWPTFFSGRERADSAGDAQRKDER
jgi:membrane protein implicated in regulation of membrane protease activity